MVSSVNLEELHLAIPNVLLSQVDHLLVLTSGVLASSSAMRGTRFLLETANEVLFKASKPLVDSFAGNTKVTGSERDIVSVLFPKDDPFEPSSGRPGESQQCCHLPPPLMVIGEPEQVPARKISP